VLKRDVKLQPNRPNQPPPGGMRSIAISVSVCLSVRSHISKTTSKLHKIFCTSPVAVARSFPDGNAISMYFLFCGRRHAFIRHVVYCDVYRRGVSVSGRQRRDGGATALKLRLSVRCFSLADIHRPQASPYITEFSCGGEQCVAYDGRSQLYSTSLFWV